MNQVLINRVRLYFESKETKGKIFSTWKISDKYNNFYRFLTYITKCSIPFVNYGRFQWHSFQNLLHLLSITMKHLTGIFFKNETFVSSLPNLTKPKSRKEMVYKKNYAYLISTFHSTLNVKGRMLDEFKVYRTFSNINKNQVNYWTKKWIFGGWLQPKMKEFKNIQWLSSNEIYIFNCDPQDHRRVFQKRNFS